MPKHICHDINCSTCGPRMRKATQGMKDRIKAAVERERPNATAIWKNGELQVRCAS